MLDDPIPVLEGVIQYAECDRPATAGMVGWRVMLVDDDPPESATFCPRCVRPG